MNLRIFVPAMLLSSLLLFSCAGSEDEKCMPVTTDSELALKLYDAGLLAFDQIKLEVAAYNLDLAIKEDPDFFMAYYWLYFVTGSSSKKVAEKALLVKADLNDGEREIRKAFRYLVDGQEEKVVEHLKNAVALYPEDPNVHKILYLLQYNYMADMEAALESVEAAIEACPEYPLAYNQKGYILMDLDRFEEAGKAFDKYIFLAPELANPYDSKGDYFMNIGQYDSAYNSYMRAYDMDAAFVVSAKKAKKAKRMFESETSSIESHSEESP